MSRKDTIIVALLINTGLLALLFMLAINTGDESVADYPEINKTLTENRSASKETKNIAMTSSKQNSTAPDEVDTFLRELSSDDSSQAILIDEEGYVEFIKEPASPVKSTASNESRLSDDGEFVEVTVKRGDALEKIARNNGTTVDAIKKANGMASNKLSIGQVLRVPVSKSKEPVLATTTAPATPKPTPAPPKPAVVPPKPAVATKVPEKSVAISDEPVYYVIKSGDTPWKIARQNSVNFDELLKLNGLNEERARNLKPGDKIRVR